MARVRDTIKKENLANGENFAIDIVVKNNYTHSIEITHTLSNKILLTIPFDPTDRTIAGVINKESLKPLGDQAENALKILSEALLSKMGAKEFILVPEENTLPGYMAPENSGFSRFRHSDSATLLKCTAVVLSEYQELRAVLDNRYHFVIDEAGLLYGRDPQKRYQEITSIMEKARFSSSKMEEYKNEELQGKRSRINNQHIRPVVMLDREKGNVAGLVRILRMGNQFSYLSDEVVDEEIVPLEKFPGGSEKEKKYNREVFLLAYLMNKACDLNFSKQSHLFIIAAQGREKIYDDIGWESFPLNLPGWKMMMKLSPQGSVLVNLQEQIKSLPLNFNQQYPSQPNKYLQYGKFFGLGAVAVGVGLLTYQLCKRDP